VFEGIIALIVLLTTPTDAKNNHFLGYSLERWILISVILFSIGMIFLLLLIRRNSNGKNIQDRMLASRWMIILSVLVLLAILGLFIYSSGNSAYFIRISPVLFFGGLVCLQIIGYHEILYHDIKQFGEDVVIWLDKNNFSLWFTLLASIPLLFANAVKYNFPLGFAGLYTLMAKEITGANFRLPMSAPYYGPGGMPFAYPPFGLYLMAGFLKLGGSEWVYLRYAPPFFSLLALVPLYLLARRVSNSKLGGMITALLAAGSFHLYYLQTESGGIVRALAFGFGLLSVYFFDRMVESFRWRYVILSGIFFGLTALTHLGYAYYFAFWIVAWMVTHPTKQNWIGAIVAVGISILVVLPWTALIVERYGFSVFSNAFQTHGNLLFLSLFQNPNYLLSVLRYNLLGVYENLWFLVLVVTGLVYLIINKKFTLPLLILLIICFLYGSGRFILTVCFIIVGISITFLVRLITSNKYIINRPWEKLVSIIVLTGLLILIYFQSFGLMKKQYPLINQEMLDVALFLKNHTSPQASYLSLFTGDDQEDEWIPYLAQRSPVIGYWGSEWIGTSDVQGKAGGELAECMRIQSLTCLDNWFVSSNKQPNYILMVTNLDDLSVKLEKSSEWMNIFSNSRYIILKRE